MKDIATDGSSGPSELVKLGTTAYFVATTTAEGTELWKSDGTTAGTSLVADLRTGPTSSQPSLLTVAGSRLYFVADDGTTGPSLWSVDGTEAAPTRLAAVAVPTTLFANGNHLYFVGTDATNGDELWRTDGTTTGLVKDIHPGDVGSAIRSFASIGSTVFFAADNGTDGSELWKSDGTDVGTVRVADINSTGASNPSGLTTLGNAVYFAADDGTHGVELWKADANGASMVRDINPNAAGSSPAQLTGVGTKLFFEANDGTNGAELWVFDSVANSSQLVKNIHPTGAAGIQALTAGNNAVFFAANDGTNGLELWKSDGTVGGTVLLKDINQGAGDGLIAPFAFTFLPTEGVLLFPGNDGLSGAELWKSDGAAIGTARVADINPGAAASSPRHWLALGNSVLFTADDAAAGRELWSVPVEAVAVPSIRCPADVTVEALAGNGAPATYAAAEASDGAGAPQITYSKESNTVFPVGETTVTATATNAATRTAQCTFKVTVKDTTKPTIECPPDFTVEASTLGGARLNALPPVTTSDTVSTPTVTYNPPAGSLFELGTTFVIAKATDAAGNSASCGFSILVRDTIAPQLTCAPNQTIEANSPTGAVAPTITQATAKDTGSNFTLTYNPPLSSTFPFTDTQVSVRAEDDVGNFSTCTFRLTVQDKTAPQLTCSSDITVEAAGPTGTVVNYPAATAVDAVTAAPPITYSAPSGSTFPIGATTVVVNTQDDAGNRPAPCRFKITVSDTIAPVITCPSNVEAEANSIKGAMVQYSPAVATDTASTPTISYTQGPGSTFPLGTTNVTATARDGSANTATCSFSVTVRDTSAPVITCPADFHAQATSANGSFLRLPSAQASDLGSIPTVTYVPALSAAFPMGTTPVTATAKDGAGNEASCSFNVIVADTQPPSISCPAQVIVEADGASGANVTFPPVQAFDLVSASSLEYSHPSGSRFPVGTTQVTVTATDAADNALSCSFPVMVLDSTPPTISCPGDIEKEATSPEGVSITYPDASATDTVSNPSIVYSLTSGMAFPLGQTIVTATARDASQNEATCTFAVVVKDLTPPTITCPDDVVAEATGANGALVKYPRPSVTDAVTVLPFVDADFISGSRFPIGTTPVTLRASDDSGNAATCTFNVTVRDSQGPALTCPSDVTVDAPNSRGAVVTFSLPTAVDVVSSSVKVTPSHESGSVFPVGSTKVTLSSLDGANNEGKCEFTVNVNAPAEEGGCSSTAPTGWALALVLAAGWRMRRRVA